MESSVEPYGVSEETLLLSSGIKDSSKRNRSSTALWCICTVGMLERLAYYSLFGNLFYLLNRDGVVWSSANVAMVTLTTNGVSYVFSFAAGVIATYWTGKFVVIAFGFLLYVVGYSLYPFFQQSNQPGDRHAPVPTFVADFSVQLSSFFCGTEIATPYMNYSTVGHHSVYSEPVSTNGDVGVFGHSEDHTCDQMGDVVPMCHELCYGFVLCTLLMIGVAVGSVKANLVPLGVDQCHGDPDLTRRFVNRFYWFTNAGAFLAYMGVVYLQQLVNTFYGTFLPLCSLLLAGILFLIGRLWFWLIVREEDASSQNVAILYYLFRQRACCKQRRSTMYLQDEPSRQATPTMEYGDKSCWNVAKQSYGGKFYDDHVSDLRTICEITCIMFTMVPFWLVYSQIPSTFVIQGWHMQFFPDLNNPACAMANSSDYACTLQVPAASMNAVNIITVIVLIPVANWLYGVCASKLHRRVRYVERIVAGYLCACVAMCVAGLVESFRLKSFWGNAPLNASDNATWQHLPAVVQVVGETPYYAPQMLIFWQIPQYFLIGLAEVLATIATLEFACSRAPARLTAVVMGLYWFVDGVANFFGVIVLQLVRGWLWFDNDCPGGLGINCRLLCDSPSGLCVCHLDYFFFLLSGLAVLGLLSFCVVAHVLDMDRRRRSSVMPFAEARRGSRRYSTNVNALRDEATLDIVYTRQPPIHENAFGNAANYSQPYNVYYRSY